MTSANGWNQTANNNTSSTPGDHNSLLFSPTMEDTRQSGHIQREQHSYLAPSSVNDSAVSGQGQMEQHGYGYLKENGSAAEQILFHAGVHNSSLGTQDGYEEAPSSSSMALSSERQVPSNLEQRQKELSAVQRYRQSCEILEIPTDSAFLEFMKKLQSGSNPSHLKIECDDTQMVCIAQELKVCFSLEHLDISGSQISTAGLMDLVKYLPGTLYKVQESLLESCKYGSIFGSSLQSVRP